MLWFNCCELLLLEGCSWGREQFENPEEGEHPLLVAATKQWLVETVTDWEQLVCVWQWFVKCSHVLCVKLFNKSDCQSKPCRHTVKHGVQHNADLCWTALAYYSMARKLTWNPEQYECRTVQGQMWHSWKLTWLSKLAIIWNSRMWYLEAKPHTNSRYSVSPWLPSFMIMRTGNAKMKGTTRECHF
jgi:hypothetical protein